MKIIIDLSKVNTDFEFKNQSLIYELQDIVNNTDFVDKIYFHFYEKLMFSINCGRTSKLIIRPLDNEKIQYRILYKLGDITDRNPGLREVCRMNNDFKGLTLKTW